MHGRVPACKWVRAACERHLRDRALESERAFAYRVDEATAAAVLGRMERLPHIKGKWAQRGHALRLEPWQCFIVGCGFGWKRKRDGLRRFRELYIEVPRKNGKRPASMS